MIDPNTGIWFEMKEQLLARVETDRRGLEQHDLPAARTEFLRGRIDAIRELIREVEGSPLKKAAVQNPLD